MMKSNLIFHLLWIIGIIILENFKVKGLLTTEISSLINPTFFQYINNPIKPQQTWSIGTLNVGYAIYADKISICSDLSTTIKVQNCFLELSQITTNHTIGFNITNYIGFFNSKIFVYFIGKQGDKFPLSFYRQVGSFQLMLLNTTNKPNLVEDNIYLLKQPRSFSNFTNQANCRIKVKIIKIDQAIRRYGHLRTDLTVGDEYLVEFTRDLDFAQNNYSYAFQAIQLYLNVQIDGKAGGWAVNNFILKNDLTIQNSCLIPKSETQCFSCPVNSVMNSQGTCDCITGFQKGLLYNDFFPHFKKYSDPKFLDQQQFKCVSEDEKAMIKLKGKIDFPTYQIQNLAHYFVNSRHFVEVLEEPEIDRISFIITIQTLTQIDPSSLDYSELMFNVLVGLPNELTVATRYIQNDDVVSAKYGKKFTKETVYQYNIFNEIRPWDDSFDKDHNWTNFTDTKLSFKWLDQTHIKISIPQNDVDFCRKKLLRFRYSFFVMGTQQFYIRINPHRRQEFYYNCDGGVYDFYQCQSAVDTGDMKNQNKINLILQGTFNGLVNGQAFLCEIITCSVPKTIFSIRFKGNNYMQIFITDPSFDGYITVEEITYKSQTDKMTRNFIIGKTISYPFRKNQIIVGFTTSNLILQEDQIDIFVQANFNGVQGTNSNIKLQQINQSLQTIFIRNVPVLNQPEQIVYDL